MKLKKLISIICALLLSLTLINCGEIHDHETTDDIDDIGSATQAIRDGQTFVNCSASQEIRLQTAINTLLNMINNSTEFSKYKSCLYSGQLRETNSFRISSIADRLKECTSLEITCTQLGNSTNGNAPHIGCNKDEKINIDHEFALNGDIQEIAAVIAHEIMHNKNFSHYDTLFYPVSVPEQVEACILHNEPNDVPRPSLRIKNINHGRCLNLKTSDNHTSAGSCHLSPSNNQIWRLNDLENGYFQIENENNHKCLNNPTYERDNGDKVSIAACKRNGYISSSQQWKVKYLGNNKRYQIINKSSRKCLNLQGSGSGNLPNIWSCRSENNMHNDQVWEIENKWNAVSAFQLKNVSYPTCLNLNKGKNGDPADVWGCRNPNNLHPNQVWHFRYVNNSQFQLKNEGYGMCLNNDPTSHGDGGSVSIFECDYGSNPPSDQLWKIKPINSQQHQIINVSSGLCLNLQSGENGDFPNVWSCRSPSNPHNDQLWSIIFP